MPKKDVIAAEGLIEKSLHNTMFRVKIQEGAKDLIGQEILATLSGKMRMYHIKVMPGDKVKLEISQYDKSRGRITYRYK